MPNLFLIFFFLPYLFIFDDCDENRSYLVPVINENIDIITGPTGLVVESDIEDHTGIQ